MSQQKVSTKHHFIPRFLLKEWQDESGALWIYQRNGGGDISFRKGAPKSVAYVENLYTIYPEYRGAKEPSDEIEKEVMAKIDDQAAIVHRKLLDHGVNALSEEERSIWSMFMASMIERSPKRLEKYKRIAEIDDYVNELHEANPSIARLIEKLDFNVQALRDNTILKFMVERVLDSELAQTIGKMSWIVAHINALGEHFVLGDDVVVINNGAVEEEPLYFIRLAISPDKLLILVYDSSSLSSDFIGTLTMVYNIEVISKSEKYVISSRALRDEVCTKFSKILEEMHRV
ncbi:DUF4238 domain-containing protein [Pseudomonas sp. C2B4]|uniref:DUF4238 domain-containing protein n=1 Tax=Pseudomonas sp. C2B4 TaxID=2735270 RepID=UPI001585DCD0|nr:DUF4238 domain-containing protein [Pseudomonas sp. C2B4]NUU34750.1 DUF4238 domain-containing protein [Pseudomonas sp. C2B4]